MNKNLLLLISLIFFAAGFARAQTVAITEKKVVYTRPKPTQDFKKTFIVNRPIVKAKTVALSKKIQAAISYERIVKLNLKEELGKYQWLEEASYTVDYNQNGVLGLTLLLEGSAAYPDSIVEQVLVDTTTGAQIVPQAVFVNLAQLAVKCRKMQQAEMKKAVADYKKDPDSGDFDASEYFQRAKFTVADLHKLGVDDNGVTFYYDYGFAHAVQALQPDGTYFFAWSDIKPFVKKDSVFARFVK